ncbi:MAG: hypothetical protein HYU53_01550 [Acidobacteria bacterium]|nr:hypothetical protein [Acidobacteriota bacterium]
MKAIAVLLATALAGPLILASEASAQGAPVDLTGRWRLNPELGDAAPKAPEPGDSAPDEDQGQVGRRGGRPGGRGVPGVGGGRGGGGGMRGDRPNPEDMAKMRGAMRFVMQAPDGMIVTRHDDELVFTADNGDITRVLVTGTTMKTTAGGAEHEVKATCRGGALIIESTFGPAKVSDTYRVSPDGSRLERVTRVEGSRGPRGAGEPKPLRRVYERVR